MKIEVRLFATFRKGRFKKKEMEFPDGNSLGNLLEHLGLPETQVGILLVNGRDAAIQRKLAAQDVVSIFPLIGGG